MTTQQINKKNRPAANSVKVKAGKDKTKVTKSNARLGGGAMKIDQQLLDTAVIEINQLHHGKCQAIGEYLVNAFFNDDIANYRENPDNLTFYELRNSLDLDVPYSSLCMILNTMVQQEVLGEELAGALGYSHQTRLLSVKNPERKRELAQSAVEKNWTVKHLDAQIASAKEQSTGGAVSPARVNSCFTKFNGAVKNLRDKEVVKFLKTVDGAKRKSLLKEVEQGIKELQKLKGVLSSKPK